MALPDMAAVDWDAALEQSCGDGDFMRELLAELHAEVRALIAQLHTEIGTTMPAASEAAWPESIKAIKMAAHTMKGSCANLMCKQISEMARWMEQEARDSLEKDSIPRAPFTDTVTRQLAGIDTCFTNFSDALTSKGIPI
jgi:HPt (histidine-containing phosphotransfer) domain-containing protein